jgi:hypothetical protein
MWDSPYREINSLPDDSQPVVFTPLPVDESIQAFSLDGRPVNTYRSRRPACATSIVRPRGRTRSSHGSRPGHRRTRSTRAGPVSSQDPDEPAAAEPLNAGSQRHARAVVAYLPEEVAR